MGDSVEDLLAKIKAQYGDDSQSPPPNVSRSEPSSQSLVPQPESSPPAESSGSIDDLLADITGKPAPIQPSGHSQSPPIPSLSSAPPPDWQTTISLPDENSLSVDKQSEKADQIKKVSTDRLLDDLKAQYVERDRAEALKHQEKLRVEALKHQAQLQQEQRRQAELKRQKHKAILHQAEEWLKRLDPRSGEAIWFEEFATKYASKLEAAIDYLGLDQ